MSRGGGLAGRAAARGLIGLLWLLHFLPLPLLAALGRGLGALLWRLGASRRRIALRNLALCFPEKSETERRAIARAHFGWLGRSVLERGLLWFAAPERLQRLMQIHGDVRFSETSEASVMWLTPHFVGLEWSSPSLMLNQGAPGVTIYQKQSNEVFDAQMHRGRSRFGKNALFDRQDGIRPVLRLIRQGYGFVNLPDMDFGAKDSAFVPFFGVPACTLLAPGRMAYSLGMKVQPVVITMRPGGQGYRVDLGQPWDDYPTADAEADALRLNHWLEARVRECPEQYLWVHKRFKTRPPGEPSLY